MEPYYNLLLVVYFIITTLFAIAILRKDILFGFVYIFLILYSLFCMIGYVDFPERVSRTLKQYYGTDIFPYFYFYLFGFMIFTFLFWYIFIKIKSRINIKIKNVNMKYNNSLFYVICDIHLGINTIFLMHSWGMMSYQTQDIVKGNRIWLFSFITLGVVILILYNEILNRKIDRKKILKKDIIYLLAYIIILLLICIKIGQRMELFMLALGVAATTVERSKCMKKEELQGGIQNTYQRKKIIFNLFVGGLIVVIGLRLIHATRGHNYVKGDIVYYLFDTAKSMLNMEFIVFQDWCAPALSLLTCMHEQIIVPETVFFANIGNIFSFMTGKSVSLAGIIKANFDNTVGMGYGLYYATEGYMMCGYFGFLISAFLITACYTIYREWFITKDDDLFRCFEVGVFAYYIISIVRGHSVFFVKGFLYYFLFGCIMFSLYNGKTFQLVRKYPASIVKAG